MSHLSLKQHIVVIGAGAIGRGYLPWVFHPDDSEFTFIDTNSKIIELMNAKKKYTTHCVRKGRLETLEVPVKQAFHANRVDPAALAGATAVFINVGPRNAAAAAKLVGSLKVPLVLSENDPATVEQVKSVVGHEQVYFAVPDVITSNTAPSHLLEQDPLAIVTEDGKMFIDARVSQVRGNFEATEPAELSKQWTAKLYLHNTPHCVAAYLGAIAGVTYVHEAMAIKEIHAIVSGSMQEMLNSLKLKWDIPHAFLEWYADKEIARFCSTLLHDPISRVAREPLRKLESEGRLMGAAQICLALGFVPENILHGIAGALLFNEPNDPDHHLIFMRRALPPALFLRYVLGLRRGEALERVLQERLGSIIERLERLAPAKASSAASELRS